MLAGLDAKEKSYNLNSYTVDGLSVENWFNLNASKSTPRTGMDEINLLKTIGMAM